MNRQKKKCVRANEASGTARSATKQGNEASTTTEQQQKLYM